MKQQTKKEVWYWLIIGIGILLVMTIGYGAKKDASNKKSTNDKEDSSQQAQVDQEEDIEEENQSHPDQSDDTEAIGGATQDNYQTNQSGGQLGQSCLLDDVELSSSSNLDKIKINLLPEDETNLPKWQASQEDDKINLSISDTSNYDIVTGSKTYQGDDVIRGDRRVEKITIDTSSGGQVSLRINLDQGRAYQVSKSTNPLRLIIKIY